MKSNKKRVTKKGNNSDVHENAFKILRCLGQGILSPSKIAKKLDLSRKTVYKHINTLEANGYYDKKEGLQNKGNTLLGYSTQVRKWRTNGVEIMYSLPEGISLERWKKYRGQLLSVKKVSYSEYNLNNQKIQQIKLKHRHLARFYNNGVVVQAPDFYGKTIADVDRDLGMWAFDVGEQLHKITGVRFLRDNVPLIRFTKYELSRVGDKIAEEARIRKKKVYVRVDKRLRVIFDFSKNFDEREAVTVDMAREDQMVMESWVKDWITKSSDLPSVTKGRMDRFEGAMVMFANNIQEYNKNIKLHLQTLKKIQEAVERLGK